MKLNWEEKAVLDQVKNLGKKIRLSITKAILESVIDSNEIQLVKVAALKDEVFDSVEHLQEYGLTSNPPKNSEVILAEIGGSRDNLIALVIGYSTDRPKDLKSGEVCLWSKEGQQIKHNEDGETEYTSEKHLFNSGGRKGSRIDDSIAINVITDSAFIAWISTVSDFVNAVSPGTIPNTPTSITGKITSGSATVELPND